MIFYYDAETGQIRLDIRNLSLYFSQTEATALLWSLEDALNDKAERDEIDALYKEGMRNE